MYERRDVESNIYSINRLIDYVFPKLSRLLVLLMFLNVPDELALQLLALLRVDLRSFCCSSHLSTLPKFCKKSSLSCRIFQHGSQYNILLHAPFRCSVPSLHSHTTFATLLPFWLLFFPNWKMWQQWHLNLFFVCAVVLLNSTCQCTWSNFACWKEKCVPWRRGVFLSLILFKYLTHSRPHHQLLDLFVPLVLCLFFQLFLTRKSG